MHLPPIYHNIGVTDGRVVDMEEDNQDWDELYGRISENIAGMVITHEGDPEWRKAVLSNRDSLLALRLVE